MTGFTGLNVRVNGDIQLYVNGAAVGSLATSAPLTSGTFYNLSYNVDTATGAISNVVFNGSAKTFTSTGFTNAATAFAGPMTRTGGRLLLRNFTVTTW